ncbi:tRNA dihydrouridine synthase DusB [Thermocaproicibacter melissae]|uniref:tRNA dihydrouridine synthase DusB n=1 Tax=Thermocaproicibacter melissae TaxID=2966552 RepID=UPI0024B03F86|nr:tRNA dihydrouridine synthase DusB [Thermocaproicibacter melissae]WBY64152.1 tRNA dihydrouridine synthase DusB [Thermocaproicibacter melissae]
MGIKGIKIGTVEIKGKAILAPMAGVGDRAFRETCARFGAACTVSEMVSSKALEFDDKKTLELMELGEEARPAAIQIFGSEPDVMALAARKALEFSPDFIDINMGCPAPKITGPGAGSALMKTPQLCGEIVAAVVAAVPVPVTVKIRAGWDEKSVNAVEVASICEQAGAAAVAVHARTRSQMYEPPADWSIIKAVKEAVKIPVIGNGDVTGAQSAARMLEQTGCDAVMVGRAALGNPWIFQQINAYLDERRIVPPPSLSERMQIMVQHVELMCRYKGEYRAMKEARKHVGWYLKGLRGASEFRRCAGFLESLADLDALVKDVIAAQEETPLSEK